jgi:hypothetical protein
MGIRKQIISFSPFQQKAMKGAFSNVFARVFKRTKNFVSDAGSYIFFYK